VEHQPRPPDRPTHQRGSLLPTILWAIATLVVLVPLVGLIVVGVTGGLTPGNRWAWIGCLILLGTISLWPGLKTVEAFLDWKSPDEKT